MITPELQNYISQSRASGMSDEQIRQTLSAQGWKDGDLTVLGTKPLVPRLEPLVIGLSIMLVVVEVFLVGATFFLIFAETNAFLFFGKASGLFPVIFIPGFIFLLARRFRRIKQYKETSKIDYSADLLIMTVFYWIFGIILPIFTILPTGSSFQLLAVSSSYLLPSLSPYSVPAIVFLLASLVFWSMVSVRKKHVLVLVFITFIILALTSLPRIKSYYNQVTLDPVIKSFVVQNSPGKVLETDVLESLPDKNLIIFVSRINQPYDSGSITFSATGLKYRNKIGWLYQDRGFNVVPVYDFDSSDSYLYSSEFLNQIQSNQSTKYTPYSKLKGLMATDPDTPFYQVNQNNY